MRILLLLFINLSFLLCINYTLFAQESSNRDSLEYYFNDGGLSARKNIIKINLASIFTGDLAFFYERALSNSISIEIGAGLLLPFYKNEWPYGIVNSLEESDPAGGYSLWFQPKYYLTKNMFEYSVLGLQIRQRNYKAETGPDITYNDINLIFGSQWLLGKHFTFGVSYGLGFRLKTDKQANMKNQIHGISLPIAIKTGFIF